MGALSAVALAAAMAAPPASLQVPDVLRACGDISGYAPFTFQRAGAAAGYNSDYLKMLFAASGRSVSIQLLPWKRCVAMAQKGEVDFVLDSGGGPQRQRDFILTKPHYHVRSVILHNKGQRLPDLSQRARFDRVKRCEILGWDGSEADIASQGDGQSYPNALQAAYAMLRAGRCEAMITQLEIIQGLPLVGGEAWLEGLQYSSVPWLGVSPMHFGISRAVPYAQALRDLMDEGGAALQKSGAAERLLRRYLP